MPSGMDGLERAALTERVSEMHHGGLAAGLNQQGGGVGHWCLLAPGALALWGIYRGCFEAAALRSRCTTRCLRVCGSSSTPEHTPAKDDDVA